MDYAFGPQDGPDPDPGIEAFTDFYRSRANTTVLTTLSTPGHPSLEGLVTHLNGLPAAEKPIGDVFICSHGNETGWLEIRLTSILPVHEVDYDVLLQFRSRLALQSSTITAASATQPGTAIRFRACRIGHANPFMQLLKSAFGGQARVTASKHLLEYGSGSMSDQAIVYEYLDYGFLLSRRDTRNDRLRTRSQAVAAFRDFGFRYYNGTAIPSGKWGEWMPVRAPRHKTTKRMRLRLAAGEPLFRFETEFRAERTLTPDAVPHSGAAPTQDVARTRARAHLQSLPQYQADWPPGRPAGVAAYPIYQRHGFNDLEAYVNGHSWTLSRVNGQSALVGARMEYTLLVPIFDPVTTLVPHNLMPADGTGPPAPRTGLDETNADLFWNQ